MRSETEHEKELERLRASCFAARAAKEDARTRRTQAAAEKAERLRLATADFKKVVATSMDAEARRRKANIEALKARWADDKARRLTSAERARALTSSPKEDAAALKESIATARRAWAAERDAKAEARVAHWEKCKRERQLSADRIKRVAEMRRQDQPDAEAVAKAAEEARTARVVAMRAHVECEVRRRKESIERKRTAEAEAQAGVSGRVIARKAERDAKKQALAEAAQVRAAAARALQVRLNAWASERAEQRIEEREAALQQVRDARQADREMLQQAVLTLQAESERQRRMLRRTVHDKGVTCQPGHHFKMR